MVESQWPAGNASGRAMVAFEIGAYVFRSGEFDETLCVGGSTARCYIQGVIIATVNSVKRLGEFWVFGKHVCRRWGVGQKIRNPICLAFHHGGLHKHSVTSGVTYSSSTRISFCKTFDAGPIPKINYRGGHRITIYGMKNVVFFHLSF